jgi:hypothetical protein
MRGDSTPLDPVEEKRRLSALIRGGPNFHTSYTGLAGYFPEMMKKYTEKDFQVKGG